MLPRALVSSVVCVAAFWPLCALACINAMDDTSRDFSQLFWVDLALWSIGGVFLNRVVLSNGWGSAAPGRPEPSGFRRAFFRLVAVSLVLLVAMVSASAPFLDFSSGDFGSCAPSLSMLLMLVVIPAGLFGLHGAFFHALSRQLAGDKQKRTLVGLVLTSFLLLGGFWLTRDALILPQICRSSPTFFSGYGGY